MIYGALLWMADKLNSEDGGRENCGPERGKRRSRWNA
nr:hypothetical protein [Komagataeibacter xylinus]